MSVLQYIEIELSSEEKDKIIKIDINKSMEDITNMFIEQGYLKDWCRYKKDNRLFETKEKYKLAIKTTNYDWNKSIKLEFDKDTFKGTIYLIYDDTKIDLITFLGLCKSLSDLNKSETGYEFEINMFDNIDSVYVTYIDESYIEYMFTNSYIIDFRKFRE